ncbi:MAG: hypothetical protein IPJ07_09000 [Acidobacteria bacterium]|nr:hypothetical protein [Acidobacteriota bacterium]
MLLARTSSGERAEFAAAMAQIISVKPGSQCRMPRRPHRDAAERVGGVAISDLRAAPE